MERSRPQSQGITRSLGELAEAFLLSKQVSGCTEATIMTYRLWLRRFKDTVSGKPDVLAVHQFFAKLQENGLGPQSLHQGYRRIGAFLRWCSNVGELPGDLMRGLRIRTPKTLPQVPTEEELRKALQLCSHSQIGRRHRALLLTLADSGLRASEALHLLVENWNPTDRSLFIRCGKGRKDRVTFVSPITALLLGLMQSSRLPPTVILDRSPYQYARPFSGVVSIERR